MDARDPLLQQTAAQAFDDAAFALDLLEQRPGALRQRLRQGLESAGAAGRVGDAPKVRLLKQDQLGVAGEPAGEGVGKAERRREREHGDPVRPADPGREGGERGAKEINPRVAAGRHPPGGLGVEAGRLRLEPAGRLDPRPEAAEGAKLRNRQELVRVRDEEKGEGVPRPPEVVSAALQRAEIGDGGGENGGELLRLARARLVKRPAVGAKGSAPKTALGEAAQGVGAARGDDVPRGRHAACRGERADRVEAEIEVERSRRVASPLGQGGEERRRLPSPSAGLDANLDEIERDAAQGAVEIVDRPVLKPEAAGRRRLGKDERQGVGASGQVGQRQVVRDRRVRMVQPLRDAPRTAGPARRLGNRLGLGIQRFDPNARRRSPTRGASRRAHP